VLRGLDFEVAPGEAVGIIGRNGAGKSTLLKIITGTTQATEGEIETGGRVAALLELGMGFHPDFTGRQNVLIAGQLMGFCAVEIAAHMGEIEAFAEIGPYIDQPVRTYSSGMQVRLAFSVATAVRPDILIVDEALAVGDAYFQHKCFTRIRQFKADGTTLLFVSHDPGAVKTLCNRAILLEGGKIAKAGSPDDVLDYYNALLAKKGGLPVAAAEPGKAETPGTRSGNKKAQILSVELLGSTPGAGMFRVGEAVTLRIRFIWHQALPELTLGVLFKDRLGNDIFGTNTFHLGLTLEETPPSARCVDFEIPELNLGVGSYSITIALHSAATHLAESYDWWDKALVFEVVPGNGPDFVGVCRLPFIPRIRP
jgi:lipopolysaccharide transport system ATP-binding protein